MKTKWMALMMVAGGTLFAETHVAIGVQFGRPAPVVVRAPVVVNAYRPPYPGPGYVWVDGYYDEYRNWYDGYWALPPYAGAYWVAPRFTGGHFARGYWGGARGVYRVEPRFAPRDNGFRERGRGPDRGPGPTGHSRQGFRR